MKSVLHYELEKRNVELGKTINAWYVKEKSGGGCVVSGVVTYIHPEARFVVINTGCYRMAFHPFAIELNGVYIDALYQPDESDKTNENKEAT